MKIYNYNLWNGECEILNVENLVVKGFRNPAFNIEGRVLFMSNINSLYYADKDDCFPYKSFKKLSSGELEIIRKEML